jgi:hypothetical protein
MSHGALKQMQGNYTHWIYSFQLLFIAIDINIRVREERKKKKKKKKKKKLKWAQGHWQGHRCACSTSSKLCRPKPQLKIFIAYNTVLYSGIYQWQNQSPHALQKVFTTERGSGSFLEVDAWIRKKGGLIAMS